MVFSSHIFLFLFLPFALLCYFASPRRIKPITLTLLSYVFYAWSDPRFVLLLVWVTLVDFTLAHWLARTASRAVRRAIVAISLTNSLGLLALFKYAVFAQSLYHSAFGSGPFEPVLAFVLPAGISFYTFESISYVVDVYRGLTPPARNPVLFACYLAQFPHLVAGPIIRYQELADQLPRPELTLENLTRGLFFLSLGLAKKILLADTLSHAVDAAFATPMLSPQDIWYATFAFAFQLYFDFSGYSDMAIGLALMLGFRFPQNFDSPYQATSITDFWRRWHMTLSRWLRDYLYIPLGGNRKGSTRTYVNLLITMLLGGLWHGAALTFAAWGLYHGILLAIERRFIGQDRATSMSRIVRAVKTAVTFLLVSLGWILFRSEDVYFALFRVAHLFYPPQFPTPDPTRQTLYSAQCVAAMAACTLVAFFTPSTWTLAQRLTTRKMFYALLLFLASVLVLSLTPSGPFLYFRF